MSGDGSYTNKAVLRKGCRRGPPSSGAFASDAKLHLPLPASDGAASRARSLSWSARAHPGADLSVTIPSPCVKIRCFAAGQLREIPVKVFGPVYWRKAGAPICLCCWS